MTAATQNELIEALARAFYDIGRPGEWDRATPEQRSLYRNTALHAKPYLVDFVTQWIEGQGDEPWYPELLAKLWRGDMA